MHSFRNLCAAALLALALVLAPVASAAPIVPAAGAWWSALAAGFDGLLDLLGHGDTGTVTAHAADGPALEPDGSSVELTDPEATAPTGDTRPRRGSDIDPNG